MKMWILMLGVCLFLNGCYRMPSDDYYSTVPLTNNPHVVPQKGPDLPGLNY